MSDTEALGLLAGFGVVAYLIAMAFCVVILIAAWKIFTKAGEAGWKALIPVYNGYVLFKIVWGNGWLFLLNCIPVVNFIVLIIHSLKLAKAYGKGAGFGIGLMLLPVIFYPMLAFGNSQYIGPAV